MTWTGPDGPHPPSGGPGSHPQGYPGGPWTTKSAHPHPAGRVAGPPPPVHHGQPWRSVWWRIGHSSWLLAPILSFGCLSLAGFLYVGIRARRPAWWIAGIAYSALINGHKRANITINRKMIADIAVNDSTAFAQLVEKERAAL